MRISDWSSYVCSSDLDVEFGLLFSSRASSGSSRSGSNSSGSRNAPLFFEQLRQVSRFEDGQRRQFFNDLCEISHEIGRASRRERVCQYVSISAVAVY